MGAAGTGLDDGAQLAVGTGGVEGVLAVGVAVEDRVDIGGGLLDDLGEDRAVPGGGSGAGIGGGACALVVRGDDDVELLAGGLQLLHGGVHRIHRVTELQALDGDRAHLGGGQGGDSADHGDLHAPGLDDRVGLQQALVGVLEVHVGGEDREATAGHEAVHQVVLALVELVVAHRSGLHAQGVQEVQGGLVVLHGGGELGAAYAVAGGDEPGVLIARQGVGDRAGEGLSDAQCAVEVVEGDQRDGLTGLGGSGGSERHHGGTEGEGSGAQAHGGAARDAACGGNEHVRAPGRKGTRNGDDGADGGTSHQTSRAARHAEGFALAEERCHPMFTCGDALPRPFDRPGVEALPGLDLR